MGYLVSWRWTWARLLALSLFLAALAQADTGQADTGQAETGAGAAMATPRPVITEIVTPSLPDLRRFPGVVRAINDVTLSFQIGGLLLSRAVDAGDVVQKGQILARLDNTQAQQEALAARANLRAALAQSEAARLAFERVEKLKAHDIAAQVQFEAAQAAYDMARAAVVAAQAGLAQAEDIESFTLLRAPDDGIVVETFVEPGMALSAGRGVLSFASHAGREVIIDVPSTHLALFAPDMPMQILRADHLQVNANPLVSTGRVRLIEPVTTATARSHRIRVTLDQNDIRLGSLVTVLPDLEQLEVLALPKAAVFYFSGAPHVWRVGAGRKLERVRVDLGLEIEGWLHLREGLQAGDEVLLHGFDHAFEGLIVGERTKE